MSDRHRNRPWGLNGGQPGGLAGTWHQQANTTSWHMIDEAFGKASPSKWSNVRIRAGRFDPLPDSRRRRLGAIRASAPREQVIEDVAEGYISPASARENYGLDGAAEAAE